MGTRASVIASEWAESGENRIKEVFVIGAGSLEANGMYARVEVRGVGKSKLRTVERNNASVYRNENGFLLSREVIGDQAGWVLGKPPNAYYGVKSNSHVPPTCRWTGTSQYAGKTPFPKISLDRRDIIESNGEKIEAAIKIPTQKERAQLAKFRSAAAFVGTLHNIRSRQRDSEADSDSDSDVESGEESEEEDKSSIAKSWQRAMDRMKAGLKKQGEDESTVPLSPAPSSSPRPGRAFFPLSPGHAPIRRKSKSTKAWSSPKQKQPNDDKENSLNISYDDRYRYYANRLKKTKSRKKKKGGQGSRNKSDTVLEFI